MERTELMAEDQTWRFSFPPVARPAQRVALLAGVVKAYGGRTVLQGLDRPDPHSGRHYVED